MEKFKMVEEVGAVTNNQAEYMALLRALNVALDRRVKAVEVYSDSELLVRQVEGRYKVKSPQLKKLYREVSLLMPKFERFSVRWIPRKKNLAGKLLA